jgi:hypothetical protein
VPANVTTRHRDKHREAGKHIPAMPMGGLLGWF